MSFLWRYIPIIGGNTNAVENNQNNQKSEDHEEEDSLGKDSEEKVMRNRETDIILRIPDSSNNRGKIILYYTCTDKALYDQLLNLNNDIEEYSEEVTSIKNLFKWAFGGNKIDKVIHMLEQIIKYLNTVLQFEEIREKNPYLDYAPIVEYQTTTNLHYQVLKRLKHNRNANSIIRILWIIEWGFSLYLVDGWEEELNISIDDSNLISVTRKVDKLSLYIQYIKHYQEQIKRGIEFRRKHYNALLQNKATNCLKRDFIIDFIDLIKYMVSSFRLYQDFHNSLNWRERRRFEEYNKTLTKLPSINITVDVKSKSVSNI